MPVLAPITQSRRRDYCLTSVHDSCPHFRIFSVKKLDRVGMISGSSVLMDCASTPVLALGRVVGIPRELVLLLIVMILLTQ